MRRVCLFLILACISMLWLPKVAAQGGLPSPIAALRLTQAPGNDLTPHVAIDPDGRPFVAWTHIAAERDSAAIELARAPLWRPLALAPLPVELADAIQLSVPEQGEQAQLLWTTPVSITRRIAWDVPETGAPVVTTTLSSLAAPHTARSLVDSQGHIHSAWLQDNAIRYVAEPAISTTLPLTQSVIDGSLVLGLDAADSPHFALLVRSEAGAMQLLYVSALAQSVMVRESVDLGDVRLVLGPSGESHLAWRDGGTLYHASSRDWGAVHSLLATAPPADQWTVACGPDGTLHLAWVAEGALWYAAAAITEEFCTGSRLQTIASLSGVDLVIDAWNQRHLAWAAPDEQGDWDIYYLPPTPRQVQLAVAHPLDGDTLLGDVLVQVVANVPPGDLLRVECYLQETSSREGEDPGAVQADLRYIGVDDDGSDGWTAALELDTLKAGLRYRVVALGVDVRGGMTRTLGGWFGVQPPGAMWAVPSGVYRGQAALPIGDDGTLTTSTPLEISLYPEQPNPLGANVEGGVPHILLATSPVSSLMGLLVPFDSRLLSDGTYAVSVAKAEATPAPAIASSAALHIANALFPEVRVTAPRTNVVFSERIEAAADATDADGIVRRVDFYLERERLLLDPQSTGDAPLTMSELVWLGSDSDGSDGWRVRVPVTERYDGDDWVVRAIAYDDQDLSTSARSEGRVIVLGRSRPILRLLSPQPHQTVSGLQGVALLVTQQPLDEVAVYLEGPAGVCLPLGLMTLDRTQWVQQWDTTRVPDGNYALVVVGMRGGVPVALKRCEDLVVANVGLAWRSVELLQEHELTGYVNVQVQFSVAARPAGTLRLFSRDADGRLNLVGVGVPTEGGWCVLWDTQSVLDGTYDLVAALSSEASASTQTGLDAAALLELRVRVRNRGLSIAFGDLGIRRAWQGTVPIAWEVAGASSAAVVDISFSPDGGAHWLTVAEGLDVESPFQWETTNYPDSAQAVLRLTVRDGTRSASAQTAPLVVNNANEAPQVAFLAPLAGSAHGEQVRLVWQAADPDRDSLIIDLDYRRSGDAWTSLAHGLANTGLYLWPVAGLAPATDYEVRVRARDLSGAFGEDNVRAVQLTASRPPIVELQWPNGDTRLSDEAVVLWTARDPQESELVIDLYYSDNAGQTWLPLAEGLANPGYYVWQVSSLPPGEAYRVRVTARTALFAASDESDQVFSIGVSTWAEASLLSPAPDSTVTGLHLVRWSLASAASSARDGARAVSVFVRRVGGQDWQTLTIDLQGVGVYLWNTRTFADGEYEMRLGMGSASILTPSLYTQPQRVAVQNRRNHTPQVALLAPHGGECWTGVHEVSWQASDVDGDPLTATLWLSVDTGQTWQQVAALDARAGRYLWDTRQAPNGQAVLLRINVSDGMSTARDTAPGAVYLTNSAGHPPQAAFTSPSAAGILNGNTATWLAQDADGGPLTADLFLSADGGETWRVLARGLSARGEYALDEASLGVSSDGVSGGRYRLRLLTDDGCYRVRVDSPEFTWTGRGVALPTLTLRAPRGGETWTGIHEIAWELGGATAAQAMSFDIEYSRDNGRSWVTQVRGLKDANSYRWDTRNVANGVYRVRVTAVAADASLSAVAVARAASASVTLRNSGRNEPVVSLLQPRNGQVARGTRELRWHAQDADGDTLTMGLAYSVDEGATWRFFANGLPNTGSYVWDTTIVPNCARVWLRITAFDGRDTTDDISDAALAVLNPYAPVVKLLSPAEGSTVAGRQQVRWVTAQETNPWVRASLDISLDGGVSWQNLAAGQPATGSYVWDTTNLPENSAVLVRVSATDGLRSALSTTREPVVVRGNASE